MLDVFFYAREQKLPLVRSKKLAKNNTDAFFVFASYSLFSNTSLLFYTFFFIFTLFSFSWTPRCSRPSPSASPGSSSGSRSFTFQFSSFFTIPDKPNLNPFTWGRVPSLTQRGGANFFPVKKHGLGFGTAESHPSQFWRPSSQSMT